MNPEVALISDGKFTEGNGLPLDEPWPPDPVHLLVEGVIIVVLILVVVLVVSCWPSPAVRLFWRLYLLLSTGLLDTAAVGVLLRPVVILALAAVGLVMACSPASRPLQLHHLADVDRPHQLVVLHGWLVRGRLP